MHPVLADTRRLAAYLGLFLVGGAVLAELLTRTTGLSRSEALVVALPTAVLHAFSCLSSWYPARALASSHRDPVGSTSLPGLEPRVVIGGLGGALAAAAIAVGGAELSVRVLARSAVHVGLVDRWEGGSPLVGATALLVFVAAFAVHAAVGALDASRRAEARAWESRSLAREAELRALRAQVDPHFLFNSLNAIAGLVVADPRQARAMCVGLADFLRRSLRTGEKRLVPLSEELAMIDRYLEVEAIRLGERLRVERELSGDLDQALVPPLLLQPLVENAIGHGVAQMIEGGTVLLEARVEEARLILRVANDCDEDRRRPEGEGIGLENVRRRVRAVWGEAARMSVIEGARRFIVEIELPETTERPDASEET